MTKSLATWARRNDVNVYTRNAGPTLTGLLSRAAQRSQQSIELDDEIDLARALVMRACSYWNAALEANGTTTEGTRLMAEQVVREAIDTVVKTVSQAAKVRALQEGAIQLSTVSWVVAKICEILDEEVRSVDPIAADRIVAKIGGIKLPVDGTLERYTRQIEEEVFL